MDKSDLARAYGVTGRFRRRIRMLLTPGIGLKRWFALTVFGSALVLLGLALGLSSLTELSITVGRAFIEYGRRFTLAEVLPLFWRAFLFGSLGLALLAVGVYELYRTLVSGATYVASGEGLIENLSIRMVRRRGPKVVAIGGGTGLSTLLRGLKAYSENLTAIVTVADDGGSSGRLRRELGMPPPGDARQCLIALSDTEPLLEKALSYRFDSSGDLRGHSMGNLLLAALAHDGDLHDALQAASRLFALKGQVFPSTRVSDLVLKAETESGGVLTGESAIGTSREPLAHLWVEPQGAAPNQAALQAIAGADLIVIGPGSLYTSLLPNFLVRGIGRAVDAVKVPKVFVCNIATQVGETDGFTAEDHLRVFESQAGVSVTHFLVNSKLVPIDPSHHQYLIRPNHPVGFGGEVLEFDIADPALGSRHDPSKLARAVLSTVH